MDKFLQERLNNCSPSAGATNVVDYTAPADQTTTDPVKAHWLGRARRWEYLPVAIVCNVILRTLSQVKEPDVGVIILSVIIGIVLIIESIRRLHDLGKSGWWIFSFIIPFVWLMTWCKGQSGPNEYGPDPRAPKGGQP